MEIKKEETSNFAFVCAIDIGTACSGFAFAPGDNLNAFKNRKPDDKEKIKIDVFRNANWGRDTYSKTKTALLLNKDCSFKAFGHEALDILDKEKRQWDQEQKKKEEQANSKKEPFVSEYLLFQNFKLSLFDGIKRSNNVSATNNPSFQAPIVDIFAACIKFMKDTALVQMSKKTTVEITESKIYWVVTIPAIWDLAARQVMIDASINAGITNKSKSNFTLAFEPECASIYCAADGILKIEPKKKYLIIDAGGGTVDTVCHEVVTLDSVNEIYPPTGGDWGSVKAEKRQFGDDETMEFEIEFSQYLSLWKKEQKKFDQTKWNLKNKPTQIDDRGRLVFPYQSFKKFFDPVFENIKKKIERLLQQEAVKGLNYILLVGGFGESKALYNFIKGLTQVPVLQPGFPGSAIMEGAVRYAFNPKVVLSRISPFTIGHQVGMKWDPILHQNKEKETYDGEDKCVECFQAYITQGQVLDGETSITKAFTLSSIQQSTAVLAVYKSTQKVVSFTSDPGVIRIGTLTMEIPDVGKPTNERWVDVTLKFTGIFVEVKAVYRRTGSGVKATLNFDL